LPTFVAAAGEADVAAKALKGYKAGTKTFNVHLDGYNPIPFFKGQVKNRRASISSTGATVANSW
jgi:hypothetical protein